MNRFAILAICLAGIAHAEDDASAMIQRSVSDHEIALPPAPAPSPLNGARGFNAERNHHTCENFFCDGHKAQALMPNADAIKCNRHLEDCESECCFTVPSMPPMHTHYMSYMPDGNNVDVVKFPFHTVTGGDAGTQYITLPMAKYECFKEPTCVGFCHEGKTPEWATRVWVHFKTKNDVRSSYALQTLAKRTGKEINIIWTAYIVAKNDWEDFDTKDKAGAMSKDANGMDVAERAGAGAFGGSKYGDFKVTVEQDGHFGMTVHEQTRLAPGRPTVLGARRGSRAAEAGLLPGDVLVEVNDIPVTLDTWEEIYKLAVAPFHLKFRRPINQPEPPSALKSSAALLQADADDEESVADEVDADGAPLTIKWPFARNRLGALSTHHGNSHHKTTKGTCAAYKCNTRDGFNAVDSDKIACEQGEQDCNQRCCFAVPPIEFELLQGYLMPKFNKLTTEKLEFNTRLDEEFKDEHNGAHYVTVNQAKYECMHLKECSGFTHKGAVVKDDQKVWIHFKTNKKIVKPLAKEGDWTSYRIPGRK